MMAVCFSAWRAFLFPPGVLLCLVCFSAFGRGGKSNARQEKGRPGSAHLVPTFAHTMTYDPHVHAGETDLIYVSR